MNDNDTKRLLYLCDGKACKEEEKKICFTQGRPDDMICKYTTDKEHAINPNNPIYLSG